MGKKRGWEEGGGEEGAGEREQTHDYSAVPSSQFVPALFDKRGSNSADRYSHVPNCYLFTA